MWRVLPAMSSASSCVAPRATTRRWAWRAVSSMRFRSRLLLRPSPSKSASASAVTIYNPTRTTDGLARRDGSAVETALRQADMAMYRAKTEGPRDGIASSMRAMDERLQERVQLEREIKGAIARGEIVPYLPAAGRPHDAEDSVGYELLARWEHPVAGHPAPGAVYSYRRGHQQHCGTDLSAC